MFTPDYKEKYVLVLLIDEKTLSKVLLVKKKSPAWQKDLYNGIGGKIEKDEEEFDAALREVDEETGLVDVPLGKLGVIRDQKKEWIVHVFVSYFTDEQLKSTPSHNDVGEELYCCSIDKLPKVIPNLRWMIPFALYDEGSSGGEPLFNVVYCSKA